MPNRAQDWLNQANRDLEQAKDSRVWPNGALSPDRANLPVQ